ncbi:33274_t:CDS:2, partial [Racocetra persica]
RSGDILFCKIIGATFSNNNSTNSSKNVDANKDFTNGSENVDIIFDIFILSAVSLYYVSRK